MMLKENLCVCRRVRDLDNCLTQSKATAEVGIHILYPSLSTYAHCFFLWQSAVGAVSARLSEKTKELNLLQLENDRLKVREKRKREREKESEVCVMYMYLSSL